MSSLQSTSSARTGSEKLSLQVPFFVGSAFLSALLLFCLEPMFSKMVLPVLGGSSAVWSVAMVVFQGLLLAGYFYAHLLVRFLPMRWALSVHVAVLLVGAFALPVAIAPGFENPAGHNVALWTMALFVTSIGAPCFAISASAPLLQAWFARTGHKDAEHPYFLYRASNFGSFAILLCYPFLIEPRLGLHDQSSIWSYGYGLLMLAMIGCGAFAIGGGTKPARHLEHARIRNADRFRWAVLGFIPSGLLVAVTAQIATDVASAPFLWIVPLALYLLTYVIAFTDTPFFSLRTMSMMQAPAAGLLALLLLWGTKLGWMFTLPGHLFVFFAAALFCQLLLYKRRPAAEDLTQFYLYMSLGGVLGGAFAAIAAPQLFDTILEYPLLMLAVLAVRPEVLAIARKDAVRQTLEALALMALVGLPFLWLAGSHEAIAYYVTVMMVLAAIMAVSVKAPVRLLVLGCTTLLIASFYSPSFSVMLRARSFYGSYTVFNIGDYRILYHGTTMHGAERVRDDKGNLLQGRPEPLSYYYAGGPYSEALSHTRAAAGGTFHNVALVGVGVGVLSCNARDGENWTLYELDPLDVRIAQNRNLFRSLDVCAKRQKIVEGDGRLMLKESKGPFDLIILDAFTSDSVPVHLLTQDAVALYKSRLSEHGALIFNISNRNIELASVVAASAAANGMAVAIKRDPRPSDQSHFKTAAEIAVVTRSAKDLAALDLGPSWYRRHYATDTRPWTDDYSDIPGAIWRKFENL